MNLGITTGVALSMRGWILNTLGEPALAKNHYWFGNDPSDKKDTEKRVFNFFSVCTSTWTYGADMCNVFKGLYVKLASIGLMDDENMCKQLCYGVKPYGEVCKLFSRSVVEDSKTKKGKKSIEVLTPPKKPGQSNLLSSSER
jgi:hypothetical protein